MKLEKVVLKTPREFRGFGNKIIDLMELVEKRDYGVYEISWDDRALFFVVEAMDKWQESINKYVHIWGDYGVFKLEIKDYKKYQDEINKVYLEMEL